MYHLQVQIYWLILQICRLRSYTSKTVNVWPRSYVVQDVIQELCILFSTTFNFIIFFSHKILVTYFLHRTKSFVLNTTSRKFCTLYFLYVKDTRQWMSLDSVGTIVHNQKEKGWYVATVTVFNASTRLESIAR